ncbi:MAG: hypothetical protein E7477_03925 [Ruminococcaceae bacterium]|nr:hypothetical protein [Oscillospiraceae bacterium]
MTHNDGTFNSVENNVTQQPVSQEPEKNVNNLEDQLLSEAYNMIQQGVFDIKSEMSRELSMHKIESKKEVYAEKEHYIETVFAVVKKQLLNFRKSEAYIDYLAKCATKANEKLGGLTRLYVTRTDLEVMKKIVSGVEVKQDLRIMLGGIIAENDGLTMDFSFDKKIRMEREKFEQKLNEL